MTIEEVESKEKKKDLSTKQLRTELELRKQQCRLVEQILASIEKENINTTQDSELIGYIQHLKGEIQSRLKWSSLNPIGKNLFWETARRSSSIE